MKALRFLAIVLCSIFTATACGGKKGGNTTPIVIEQKQSSDYLSSVDKAAFEELCSKYHASTNNNKVAIEDMINGIQAAMGGKLFTFSNDVDAKFGGIEPSLEQKKDVWNKIFIPYFTANTELIQKVPAIDLKTKLLNTLELSKSAGKNKMGI